jgi:hypothetical protein
MIKNTTTCSATQDNLSLSQSIGKNKDEKPPHYKSTMLNKDDSHILSGSHQLNKHLNTHNSKQFSRIFDTKDLLNLPNNQQLESVHANLKLRI